MITANFSGNFGNSILQYAITRTVTDKLRYEFGFNPRFNYDYHNGYNQLEFLDLDYGHIHTATFHENPEGIDKIWTEPMITTVYENGDHVNYHPYSPEIFKIEDGTKLVVPCCQDTRYYDRNKLLEWIQIKQEYIDLYEKDLKDWGIALDDNLCVINVRGGEYIGIPHVLLQKKYWDNAIHHMQSRNPNMKFLVVSDDPYYARTLFDYPIVHKSIGMDYYILNHAKNLIISNSSFAIIPVWLNQNDSVVIAPKWWARHNISTGYWASSDMWTFPWNFIDREGKLS